MQAVQCFCDFCRSTELNLCYAPTESERDSLVFVCELCGLIQSRWSTDYKSRPRVATISSGANWGNIRHGKRLRLDDSLRFIQSHLADPIRIASVLDIGSNRGHFMKAVPLIFPNASEVLGIEPDAHVIDWCRADVRQRVIHGRLEDISLKDNHFDFVFSSHTLEHSHSAREMLKQTYDCISPGGLHFLEVPNIENLKDRDIVEEFFIDKHSFHFDRELLVSFLRVAGFDVIAGENSGDCYNVTLLLRKAERDSFGDLSSIASPTRAHKHRLLIADYAERLSANRSLLKRVAGEIERLAQGARVALWGGGRIFDALVRFGGLDTRKVMYVIDTFIGSYLPRCHGLDIVLPNVLATDRPDCVVVLARSSAEPILATLETADVPRVVRFSDILQGVRDAGGDKATPVL